MSEPPPPPTPNPSPASASPPKGRLPRVIATLVVLLAVDQLTKWIAVETLRGRPRMTFFFDTFRLVYAETSFRRTMRPPLAPGPVIDALVLDARYPARVRRRDEA